MVQQRILTTDSFVDMLWLNVGEVSFFNTAKLKFDNVTIIISSSIISSSYYYCFRNDNQLACRLITFILFIESHFNPEVWRNFFDGPNVGLMLLFFVSVDSEGDINEIEERLSNIPHWMCFVFQQSPVQCKDNQWVNPTLNTKSVLMNSQSQWTESLFVQQPIHLKRLLLWEPIAPNIHSLLYFVYHPFSPSKTSALPLICSPS